MRNRVFPVDHLEAMEHDQYSGRRTYTSQRPYNYNILQRNEHECTTNKTEDILVRIPGRHSHKRCVATCHSVNIERRCGSERRNRAAFLDRVALHESPAGVQRRVVILAVNRCLGREDERCPVPRHLATRALL